MTSRSKTVYAGGKHLSYQRGGLIDLLGYSVLALRDAVSGGNSEGDELFVPQPKITNIDAKTNC